VFLKYYLNKDMVPCRKKVLYIKYPTIATNIIPIPRRNNPDKSLRASIMIHTTIIIVIMEEKLIISPAYLLKIYYQHCTRDI